MRIRSNHRADPGPTTGDVADEVEDHDRGLSFDVQTLMARRHALKLMAGAGALTLVGCGVAQQTSTGASTSTTAGAAATSSTAAKATTRPTAAGASTSTTPTTAAAAATASAEIADADTVIPTETGGPYPGDGTNGPNVLTESGIVRRDIRSSFGGSSGTAEGVPLTITLHLNDIANGGSPLVGAAVYAWHCTRDGKYSMYSPGVADQNYLRGVQETDANGDVTFTSIFPAAYDGRWPHVHFEVYPSLAEATAAGTPTKTSQLAFPKDVCDVVYATAGYEASVKNLASTSLTRDMVFGDDGAAHQLATVTGSVAAGYVATLPVGV
jgi:protocatechuate 3,4-dioxygenase beta subunit